MEVAEHKRTTGQRGTTASSAPAEVGQLAGANGSASLSTSSSASSSSSATASKNGSSKKKSSSASGKGAKVGLLEDADESRMTNFLAHDKDNYTTSDIQRLFRIDGRTDGDASSNGGGGCVGGGVSQAH